MTGKLVTTHGKKERGKGEDMSNMMVSGSLTVSGPGEISEADTG